MDGQARERDGRDDEDQYPYGSEPDAGVTDPTGWPAATPAGTPPPGYRAVPVERPDTTDEHLAYLESRPSAYGAHSYEGGRHESGADEAVPYEPPSLTRPVHDQPAFGRPAYDRHHGDRWSWREPGPQGRIWEEEQEDPSGAIARHVVPRDGALPDAATTDLEPVRPDEFIQPSPGTLARLGPRAMARRRPESDGESGSGRGRRTMPLWQEVPLLLLVAFCMAVLIRAFLVQAFYIPSGSMEDTLMVGDRVLVNKIVYDVRTPERGEVIVFRGSDTWAPENIPEPPGGLLSRIGRGLGDLVGVSRPGEKDFIKRVIGLPGDRVSCCDNEGRVFVNGVPLDEPYVRQNSPLDVPADPRVCRSRNFDEVLVPAGQLFVMGDHRIVSQDSRCQGTVPIDNVIGRAFVIVWPSARWGTLGVPDDFAGVPGPVALGPAGSRPVGPPDLGAAAVTIPILASLEASARRVQKRRVARRTLRR